MSDTAPSIVTPEAVILDFETAGVGSRTIAKLLDLFVQLAAFFAVVMVVGVGIGSAGGGEAVAAVVIAISVFLILFGYPAIAETLWNGKTLGKAAMGVRAVTREGAPIRFRHAAVRSVIGLIEVYALSFIAVISATASRNNQRVGDLAGGTIVIRERSADRHAVSLAFYVPAGYETYAQSLDVSSIDARQYQVIRSFLTRVLQLSPEARMAMALRLANPVAVELDHQPPAGIGPELFLVCVAAAYQQRHGGVAPQNWSSAAWSPQGQGAPGSGAPGYGAPGWPTPAAQDPAAWGPPTAGGYGWGPAGQPPYASAAPPPPSAPHAAPPGATYAPEPPRGAPSSPPPPPPGYVAAPSPLGGAPAAAPSPPAAAPAWSARPDDTASSGFDPPA